jgi:diguanylate cyclase (GGDEF)-like protein/PAS domain S-box-containing protein
MTETDRPSKSPDRGVAPQPTAHAPASTTSSATPSAVARQQGSCPADGFERALADRPNEGVYYVDRARGIRYWNKGAEQLTGFEASAMIGRFCYDNLLNHLDAEGRSLCRSLCPLAATIRDGRPRDADVFLHHRLGHRVPIRVRVTPVKDREGKIIGAVEIFNDTRELAKARREPDLRDLTMTDAVTGLPSRRHFDMALSSRVAELAGYGRRFGLLIADIDRLTQLNDAYGQAVGDAALRTVATALLESSRLSDDIARFGGETIVLTVVDVDADGLRVTAERCRRLVSRSAIRADDHDLRVTVSIGGTIAAIGDTAEAIFERADAALCRAKDAGRNRVELL